MQNTFCPHCKTANGFEVVEEVVANLASPYNVIRIVRCRACKTAIGLTESPFLHDRITKIMTDLAYIEDKVKNK